MDLLDSLHELEDLVASSSRFLLTNKCLVNEEELIRLISNIRKEWPSALKEAEEINANRDKIIEDARIEAKNIIEQAKVYAQKKASENEITLAAEAKAKEIRKIAEGIIALGVKECNNFDTVKVTAKVARKDKDGKRVKEVVDGKKVTVYDEVEREIKKDQPSRLHARRQMQKTLFTVTEVPADKQSRRKDTKKVDVVSKVLDDIAPKYTDRNGGYTRIVKIGQRKGDAAMEVLIELV